MSRTLPPKVHAAKSKPHHVFDFGGKPAVIAGSLDYRPPPDQAFNKVLIIPIALLAAVGAAAVWLKRRRTMRR